MSQEFQPSLKPLDEGGSGPAPTAPVPGFWPRLGAFALDVALLSLFSYLLVKRMYPVLYAHRWTVQAVAMLLVWLYFIIGYSPLSKGQTIGKLVLGFRVVNRRNGGDLEYSQVLIRGTLSFVCAFAVAFAINFVLIGTLPLHFENYTPGVVGVMFIFCALACAYALAAAIMAGLHPRKLSIHDMLAGTAVVRSDEVERGMGFVNNPGPADTARIRSAAYPAVVMAVIIVFMFTQFYRQANIAMKKAQPAIKAAQKAFDDLETLRLVSVSGPSQESLDRWKEFVRQRTERYNDLIQSGQKAEADKYSTMTLDGIYPGQEFQFIFESYVAMTSETLVQQPEYQTMQKRLPEVAAELAQEFFVDEDGQPRSWYAIHSVVREVLPAFMYTEIMIRHRDDIDLGRPTTSTAPTTTTIQP